MNKKVKAIIASINLAVISGVLLLLGWGFYDILGFFIHPARTIMYFTEIILYSISNYFIKKVAGSIIGEKGKEVSRHRLSLILIFVVGYCSLFFCPFSDRSHFLILLGGDITRYIGLGIFIIGSILMIWAPLHLGKQFSGLVTIQKDHKLITDGPYKYIRHPRYLGGILGVFGIALIFISIIGILLAIGVTILLIWRIIDEEKLLHETFGDEWEEYRKRTKKLIPFIY